MLSRRGFRHILLPFFVLTLLSFTALDAGQPVAKYAEPPLPAAGQPGLSLSIHGLTVDTRAPQETAIPAEWRDSWGRTGFYIVQFYGPVRAEWKGAVEQIGGRFVESAYFPNYAFLVWLDSAQLEAVTNLPFVNWVGVYHPWYKNPTDPESDQPILFAGCGYSRWRIVALPDMLLQLNSLGLAVDTIADQQHYAGAGKTFVVSGEASQVAPALKLPGVLWIEPILPVQLALTVARELHQSGTADGCEGVASEVPVWTAGFTAAGTAPACTATRGTEQLIGIIDTTFNSPDLECESGIPNCTIMKFADYTTIQTPACSMSALQSNCISGPYHGTCTSGIMVGNGSQDGGEYPVEACVRKGHAFGGRIWAVKCDTGVGDFNCITACHGGAYQNTLRNFFLATYADGSRLSNHSWGAGPGVYDSGCEAVDAWAYDNDNIPGNGVKQKYLWFFAAGNNGPAPGTMLSPGVAKNDLTGAAVYNGVNGSCYTGDTPPCDENKLVRYSSRGPAPGNRHGPDLAGASQYVWAPFDGSGYTPFAGTSAATPALVALGAQLRDWLTQMYAMEDANASLVKALLLNSGDYIISPMESLPGAGQGWGRADLQNLCDDWTSANCASVRSKWYEDSYSSTGQEVYLSLPVSESSKPLRCMLAWMDRPNLAGGGVLVNNLDLRLIAPDSSCYRANNFSGPWSASGCDGSLDSVNPDEGIRVYSPATGNWIARVSAANIANGPQPWSLVCSGAIGDFSVLYPDIDATPSPISYGDVPIGSSLTLDATVENAGDGSLNISSVSDPPAPFTKTADSCSGASLAPGETCSISVTFSPVAAGSFSGSLSITSNDPDENPYTISLDGTGVSQPDIGANPNPLDFGTVKIGNTGAADISIINEGTSDLTISGVSTPAFPFLLVADYCAGLTLAPSETCIVTIGFAPELAQPYVSSFDISSNDPDENPFTVAVQGNGTPCLFCDDFENGQLDMTWTYLKPEWSESGGALNGTPTGRKAVALAKPAFEGCRTCYLETRLQTAGGLYSKVWVLGWYADKRNTMELIVDVEKDKLLLKQRNNGVVVAKSKTVVPLDPDVSYTIRVTFDGTVFLVSLSGVPLFSLEPKAVVREGVPGFQVKNTTGSFEYIEVN